MTENRSDSFVAAAAGAGAEAPDWGRVRTLSDRLELRLQGSDRSARLEPQSMRVWLVLLEVQGSTLRWNELHRRAWGQRPVTDDAMHRQLAKLRRSLDSLEPGLGSAIETLPRVGVLLRSTPAEPAPAQPAVPPKLSEAAIATSPRPRWTGWSIAALLATVSAAVGVGWWWQFPASRLAYSTPAIPQTAASGWEVRPAWWGPGDDWLYRARRHRSDPWEVWLHDASGARRLSTDARDYRGIAAAPDGLHWAALVRTPVGCSIEVFGRDGNSLRRLGDCTEVEEDSLIYSADGDALLLARRRDADSPYRLSRIDIASGLETALTSPPAGGFGDIQPVPAPDGGLIAFLRLPVMAVQDLYLLDVGSGTERRLTQDHLKLHGATWSGDSRRLVVSSNRHGPFGLWQVDTDGRWSPLASGLLGEFPVLHRDGRLLFEQWTVDVNLWSVPLCSDAAPAMLTALNSSVWDWNPMLDAQGRVRAWLSTRSGPPELWLDTPEGPRQRSRFGGPYLREAALSPDGRSVAVTVSAASGFDLLLIDLDSEATRPVMQGPGVESAPAWTADGRLLFVSDRSGTSLAYEFDPRSASLRQRGTQATAALREEAGRSLRVAADRPGLHDDTAAAADPMVASLNPVDGHNWHLAGSRIGYLHRDDAGRASWRSREGSGAWTERMLGRVPMPGRVAVSADGCTLVLPQADVSDADLRLLRPDA